MNFDKSGDFNKEYLDLIHKDAFEPVHGIEVKGLTDTNMILKHPKTGTITNCQAVDYVHQNTQQ